jgi:hypothetical protein
MSPPRDVAELSDGELAELLSRIALALYPRGTIAAHNCAQAAKLLAARSERVSESAARRVG